MEDGAHPAIEFCFDKSKGRLVEVSIGTACYSLISSGHNRGFRPAYIADILFFYTNFDVSTSNQRSRRIQVYNE